ncbi:E3 ubiquitin-protein ligase dtx4 [Bulinus truncatus]|nr:E3 ubiquitin-protein ligase dtx4 [Bulinus truncatus]
MAFINSSSSSTFVIWLWCNERGIWTPYDPQVSNKIEVAYQSRQSQNRVQNFQISISNPSSPDYLIDFQNMKQIRLNTGNNRDIRRSIVSSNSCLAQGILWEFEGDSFNQWSAYNCEILNHIEAAFLQRAPHLDLLLFGQPYLIDFKQNIQVRHDTGTTRKIRRRQLSTLYMPDSSNSLSANSSYGAGSSGGHVPASNLRLKRHTSRAHPYSSSAACSSSSNQPVLQRRNVVYRQIPANPSVPSLSPASVLHCHTHFSLVPFHSPEPVTESLPIGDVITIDSRPFSTTARSGLEVLGKYMMSVYQDLDKSNCSICFDKLSEPSSYGDNNPGAHDVVKLIHCGHMFHKLCLLSMYSLSHKGNSLQCPSCNTIYGDKTGICPPGTMKWNLNKYLNLSGYEGYGAICVTYQISSGVQGPEHPQPGKPFTARGFPRQGFLPDCNKGRKVLKLLIEAFKRRLMFTIATSHTTGEQNTVTWNEIHHKTEPHGNARGHGYPDPKYLDNVLLELAAHGVTE